MSGGRNGALVEVEYKVRPRGWAVKNQPWVEKTVSEVSHTALTCEAVHRSIHFRMRLVGDEEEAVRADHDPAKRSPTDVAPPP